VDEHVRIELGDGLDDSVVLVGVNSVEDRTLEPVSRRIGVDTRQFSDPRLCLEEAGDRGAQLTADSTDEDPFPSHTVNASTTRRPMIGPAVALVPVVRPGIVSVGIPVDPVPLLPIAAVIVS